MRGRLAERLGVGVQEKYYATSTGGTPTDRTAAHPTAKPLPRGTKPVPRCLRGPAARVLLSGGLDRTLEDVQTAGHRGFVDNERGRDPHGALAGAEHQETSLEGLP